MKNYRCPKCQESLCLEDKIVLYAENEQNERGLICLSSDLGDYSAGVQASLSVEKGDHVKMYCPLCRTDLTELPEKGLAKIELLEERTFYTVFFSVKYGKNATYKVKDKRIAARFGADVHPHIDFDELSAFGGGMM